MPTTAPSSPCRTTTGCSSPVRPARSTSSQPRTVRTRAASPPRPLPSHTLSLEAGAVAEGRHAHPAGVYLDRADRALADLDAVVEIQRHAEREQNRAADHVAMARQHDGLVQMPLVKLDHRRDDALLHGAHALAAGDRGEAPLRAPGLPARVGADHIKGRAGPFAEIELQEIVAKLDRQAEPRRDDLGGLAGALQRACIERGDLLARETLGLRCDLGAAALGHADPRHAPREHLT